jgi:hypothetical protein
MSFTPSGRPVQGYDAGRHILQFVGDVIFRLSLGDLSPAGHNHDSEYASLSHHHDGVYSPVGHNHDSEYAALSHNHDEVYSPIGHNHDSEYAALSHNHDGVYSPIGHNHDSEYAALSHNHDDDYMQISDYDSDESGRVDVAEAVGNQYNTIKYSTIASDRTFLWKGFLLYDASDTLSSSDIRRGTLLSIALSPITLSFPAIAGLEQDSVIIVDESGAGLSLSLVSGDAFYIGSTSYPGLSNVSSPQAGDYIRCLCLPDDNYLLVLDSRGAWQ